MLICTRCLGPLWESRDVFRCVQCSATYRTLRGIPDLRTAEDEFLPNDRDWAFAKRLDEHYDRLDFAGLLDLYYELSPEITPARKKAQVAHILSASERSETWMRALGDSIARGPVLDLGCGPGSFLAARARAGAGDGRGWWGVDIAMRWLLLARKRLDEKGMTSVRLICGCAESLPFADRAFAAVVGGDVIEHVRSAEATLSEAHRVLNPNGRLFLATPNRFSLAPEPHVGLLGVGYLPRLLMNPYVRLRRKGTFRAIHTRGIGGWKRLLRRSPFGRFKIDPPPVSISAVRESSRVRRVLSVVYNFGLRSALGRAVARRVGPMLHLVCDRAAEEPSQPLADRPRRQQGCGQRAGVDQGAAHPSRPGQGRRQA